MNKSKKEQAASEQYSDTELREMGEDAVKLNPDNKNEETADKVLTVLEAELSELREETEKLRAESAAEKDSRLRLAAEYDNFRKRSQREREQVYAEAYAASMAAFLPVLDNLERAAAADCTDGGESLLQGIRMTLKQVSELCAKLGIEEICVAPGDCFDPSMHNAVMHVEDQALGENTVAEILLKGYKVKDRVVRPVTIKHAN